MKTLYIPMLNICLCIVLCIAPGMVAAQSEIPDAGQLDWLVLSPLDMPNQDQQWFDLQGFQYDYLKSLGGEAQARPLEGEQTAGKVWERLQAPGMPLDFNQLAGQQEVPNAVAYAYTTFESPTAQHLALKFGSDDGVKVWFNGVLLLSHHIHRSMAADQEALVLPVQAGKNHLLIKVDQGYGSWAMTARFRSMADEQKDWEQAENVGLQIQPLDTIVQNPAEFFCTVNTVPAFAVQLPIRLEIVDPHGNALHVTEGLTGAPLPMPLAADFQGITTVRATGLSETMTQSVEENVLFGDPATIMAAALPQAKTLTASVTDRDYGDLLAPTLAYYVDLLEGNVHPDLITEKSIIEAATRIPALIMRIEQDTWGIDAFRGLHQWAYRSTIDDALQPYTLYVPDSYDPAKAYSLIVALHGYSGNDSSMASQIITAGPRPDDFLVVAPYGRGDVGYVSIGEQDVLDVMQIVQTTFAVDPNRVYLMGSSMGGLGTWGIGQSYPEKFAAMAPFAGWSGTQYLENLRNLPTLIVHGDQDMSVSIYMDQAAAARLTALKYPVRFDILPGGGHDALNVWMQAGGSARVYDYFRQHQRNPWPAEVVLKTNYLRYGQRYWVELLELADMPSDGEIMARVVDAANIQITTKGVSLLRLNLANPNLAQEGAITITIDGVPVEVNAQERSATFQAEGKENWRLVSELPTPEVRHTGGGLGDLFMRPLLIVYGTQARQAVYQKIAALFADWRPTQAMRMGSKTGKFRVKADVDVTADDAQKYDLLLIGGPEENVITGQIAAQLPLRFTDTAVELDGKAISPAGLLLTCPNPQAPARLVSVLTLPFNDKTVQQFALMTALSFRMYRSDEYSAAPMPFPDVAIFESKSNSMQVRQIGWFDYAWQNIRWQAAR